MVTRGRPVLSSCEINGIFAGEDWPPDADGCDERADIAQKQLSGVDVAGKTFKVHLDGINLLPFLKGEQKKSPREGFLYWSDDGDLLAIRVQNWKVVFLEQRAKGLGVWREPFSPLRIPKLFNLRADPFEQGDDSTLFYDKWMADRSFVLVPAQALAAKWIESFKDFPIRQKPAAFNLDRVVEQMMPHT